MVAASRLLACGVVLSAAAGGPVCRGLQLPLSRRAVATYVGVLTAVFNVDCLGCSQVLRADEGPVPAVVKEDSPASKLQRKALRAAQEKVLTLAAYLDELERSIIRREWRSAMVYAYTFAEQDGAFVALIDGLFPSDDALDGATREALTYEAREMFLAVDSVLDAAKKADFLEAQRSYSKLVLNYDHFLKAGSLYPTYDPITSTEIFFRSTPLEALRFDQQTRPQLLDEVLILGGPDMGKTGVVLWLRGDGKTAVVKLDKNGSSFNEIKVVSVKNLGKVLSSPLEKQTQTSSRKLKAL